MSEQQGQQQEHWAVVGGGMLGLTLAHRLSQQGYQVSLIEARPTLGGLADAWQVGDVTWDRHYHVISLSDMRLRNLLAELDLEDDIQWVETKTGFFAGGKYYSLSSALEFLKFPPLNLIEKFRLGTTIFYASRVKNWKRLEQLTVVDWLSRWSGKSTVRKIWLPLLKAKLGNMYTRTSAAFIWAYIDRMYRARRTGLKKEMFGYVPGGYKTILARFDEVLSNRGVRIRVDSPVSKVQSNSDGTVQVSFGENESEAFDKVILTTPTPLVSKMCPELTDEEHEKFGAIEYLGIVCASVILKKELAGYYVTNILDEVPFTAVIEMTALVDPAQLNGHTLAYLPKYCSPDDPVVTQTDEEVEAAFMKSFRSMYPNLKDEDISAFKISRVKYVMALPTLNYSEKLPPMVTSIFGVFAVNSAHIVEGNLNVNETIEVADRAIKSVLPLGNANRKTKATLQLS